MLAFCPNGRRSDIIIYSLTCYNYIGSPLITTNCVSCITGVDSLIRRCSIHIELQLADKHEVCVWSSRADGVCALWVRDDSLSACAKPDNGCIGSGTCSAFQDWPQRKCRINNNVLNHGHD